MAIIGWLAIAVITLLAWACALMMAWGSLALRGKPGGEFLFFVFIASALSYLTYRTFPFIVTVAP